MLMVKKATCDGPRSAIPERSDEPARHKRSLPGIRPSSWPARIEEGALQPKATRRFTNVLARSAMVPAKALVDFTVTVGSVLTAEFLAGCAAYACAMYPYYAVPEEREAEVELEPVSDRAKSDRAHTGRGNLHLIARQVSLPVEDVESHRPLPLPDAQPFMSNVPLVSQPAQSSPAWYASIGAAALALGRSIAERRAVRRSVAELRQLDDRLLRDMGLCRLDIENAVKGEIDLR